MSTFFPNTVVTYTSPSDPLDVVHSVFENVMMLNKENGLRNRVSRGV